ncbi:hypothetical protein K493DRAFT_305653 [Basidiobolus meristosporus CBS 931.73]|uniref:Uncharacterized protein n=1 Tax=Basidiobolus meristosporus CBS 931.73 TaxID=1314790 RepID=A0A1Y1XV65_9FUNG|nr:hypothetical protein K493DRAFT_305653 [Basidiobolus meristosporus CBS 931.73]|eukprot:ORX89575.1 hypothetical protein K493DRAFT_305653 [Basidiobolus meristosporus CBS 931.73]
MPDIDTTRKETLDLCEVLGRLSEDNGPLDSLVPTVLEDIWVWYVPGHVYHPLKAQFGPRPFFLFTAATEGEQPTPVAVENISRISVGPLPTGKKAFLGGTENYLSSGRYAQRCDWPQRNMVPISRDAARYYLSKYALAHDQSSESPLPAVFAYSYQTVDSQEKMYSGIEAVVNGSQVNFLQYQLKDEETVARSKEDAKSPIPTLEETVEDFQDLVGSPSHEPSEGRAYARYEILGESMSKEAPGQISSVVMEAAWEGMVSMLSPPPTSALVTLLVKSVDGNLDYENHLSTQPLLRELNQLVDWYDCCTQGVAWESKVRRKGIAADIDDFLDDIKNEGGIAISEETTAVEAGMFNSLPVRKDLDFTEKLWKYCQDAINTDEIVDCLTATIDELETGKLQPLVHKGNHSSLANLIRDCLKLSKLQVTADYEEQKETISRSFDYWLEQPLECLVEANDLATWDTLEPFLEPTIPLEDQLQRLRYLHRILELWSLVKTNVLAVPYESLRLLVQDTITYYTQFLGDSEAYEFEQPLHATINLPRFSNETDKLLTSLVRSFEPCYWELSLVEESGLLSSFSDQENQNCSGTMRMQVTFNRKDELFSSPPKHVLHPPRTRTRTRTPSPPPSL